MSLAKVIGNNIHALMKKQNVKIKQLADLIGVTRQTMTKYLEGEVIIDSEKLFKIAEFFGKPLDYFLENKHEEMAFYSGLMF
ncbi:helix-turn-helix domain-containing protein [Caldicellulosiruptor bescii]|uniref:Transcriptional regulator, XRE family n=1 Tax=Caldicellulosiruptor bescii (strain ATCC BAA-1888 / DSM 6725 / KCTC 15123 / Z-1320) TaxID=521460 RepID=B9MLP6_CALBD|nr:helix-turn-helix transcriptional regulator [Caldicellulosiruptor bescii]ACM59254.1 transcriptional regulator, XRE family [Caldicellulosiruptor bescii DSM 6725]